MNPYVAGGIFAFYLASVLGAAAAGYSYEHRGCAAADAQHDLAQSAVTIAGQEHVINQTRQQGSISQEASNEYAMDSLSISSAYALGVQPPATDPGHGLRALSLAATGTCPDGGKSKVYKLTPQQCDSEEAKCNALWNWATQQAAVK